MIFRNLKADEIECRISQLSKDNKKAMLLLYKTARTDRQLLDEVYPNLWQNDFKLIDGKMYGGIGIYNKELGQWLWRWDCGVESNTEAEKGQASDCFKRAGFKWGVGIELYNAPVIWVTLPVNVNGEPNKYERFDVKSIDITEDKKIVSLVIVDSKGQVAFAYDKKQAQKPTPKPMPKIEETDDTDKDNHYDDYKQDVLACTDIAKINLIADDARKHCKELGWTQEQMTEFGNIIHNKIKAIKEGE